MTGTGPARFARYAYPPNALGYCGPQGEHPLIDATDEELRALARGFEGAWPYLVLLGAHAGLDPLDPRVVDAYWLGNDLATAVTPSAFERGLRPAVDGRTGVPWEGIAADIAGGGRPTHAFHVFSASPWVSLLARGVVDEPLRVLDRCRIAWGEVVTIDGEHAVVRSAPLAWNGSHLTLGAQTEQRRLVRSDGAGRHGPPSAGDQVTLHWDWICEPVDAARLRGLCDATDHQLALTNRHLAGSPEAGC